MLKVYAALCLIAAFISSSSALRCWTCENARSPGQCIEFGRGQRCRKTEKVCQTEIRFSSGWGEAPFIKTGCKEQHACGNNHVQNPKEAWNPSQCNKGVANSVCRCCCSSNNCNQDELMCESMFGETPPPFSRPICKNRPSAPGNGSVNCQRSRYPGSRCKYACKEAYELIGNREAICRKVGDEAIWIGAMPICRRLPVCDPIRAPENGNVKCFGTGVQGTYCEFSCNERFQIEGASAVTCIRTDSDGLEWSDKTPTCDVAKCKEIGDISHGNITCTRSDYGLETTCSFNCSVSGFFLTPADTDMAKCVWRNGRAKWNRRKPCCSSVVCPPNAKKDIIIAIDSSGSISSEEWVSMRSFVIRVLSKFNISPNQVQVSMFRFNRDIDTQSEISFGDHDNFEDLKEAIENMPKNGGGTYIGKALAHVRDNILGGNNRPGVSDMLWVLTDGKSNDKFKGTAKQLRDRGLDIIALGISRKGEAEFMKQLVDITGNRDLVMLVNDVFRSFAEDLVQLVTSKMCEVNCIS